MNATDTPAVYTAGPTGVGHDQGSFRTRFNFPGRLVPDGEDHGHGPLAIVVESFMDPDTLIPMHWHRYEEIISWVPAGVMRHDDEAGNELVTDPEHLLVMNAGRGFRHEERTLASDPPLRMLQIFVRPPELELPAAIQHEPLPAPIAGEWRHVFGPEGGDALAFVRNAVDCHDLRIGADDGVALPSIDGRDVYLYVFEGSVRLDVGGDAPTGSGTLDRAETALVVGDGPCRLVAETESTLVAFSIDPDAPITRRGTIGR